MDGVLIGATQNVLMRNGMLLALAIFVAAVFALQPVFGLNGLWAALHIFFLARGLIYWFAMQRKLPALFGDN